MKWWKPSGVGGFEYGAWLVQKDWASGLWDIYRDGKFMASGFSDAQKAVDMAEKLMGATIVEVKG